MCLGCGIRAPKAHLARFVAVREGDALVLTRDHAAREPGRGLYTCRTHACFMRAAERRGFARAARGAVRVDMALAEEFEHGEAVSGA